MKTEISDVIIKLISKKAREKGVNINDYLLNLISKELNVNERIDLYLRLHDKYLKEAKTYERKGDILQAGEKYWEALTSLLNAIAEYRGWRHFHHRDYNDIIEKLSDELEMPELARLFASAERLHSNYYHNFLRQKTFNIHKNDIEKLITKLKETIKQYQNKT